ncbi:MAG: hypothetical protein IIW89_05790 [Alistipes sp.]|nr:hypothetical protein [Alistipes sp.]
MRTIKFRGKRVDNGEWVYGDLLRIHGVLYIYPDPAPNGWNDYEVIPDTVGQFTGLHDVYGKEIYEGDVVDFVAYDAFGNERGNEQGVVRFTFCAYQIGGYDMYDVLLNDDCAEVIGNIHDNPELLKSND